MTTGHVLPKINQQRSHVQQEQNNCDVRAGRRTERFGATRAFNALRWFVHWHLVLQAPRDVLHLERNKGWFAAVLTHAARLNAGTHPRAPAIRTARACASCRRPLSPRRAEKPSSLAPRRPALTRVERVDQLALVVVRRSAAGRTEHPQAPVRAGAAVGVARCQHRWYVNSRLCH